MSLSIALTKGRLEKTTVDMLKECGYGVDGVIHKNRELVIADTVKDIRYFLVKSNDCITYVEHGVADVGIVGKDTLMEADRFVGAQHVKFQTACHPYYHRHQISQDHPGILPEERS